MDIYVGNLSYDLTEQELREAFEQHGEVTQAKIVIDRDTGRSKGFGFVEMPNKSEGEAAIAELNGAMIKGRTARVNQARPRGERPPRRQQQS
jgi:RNA recognition motif-containing protein